MRRTVLVVALVLVSTTIASPARAHPGHPGPRISRFGFVAAPLKAGALERLVVVAHDPDSWISEIQVRWENADGNGGIIFAHTYCVQDPTFEHPGTRARLKLDVTFEHPGDYHVEARAISEKRCETGDDVELWFDTVAADGATLGVDLDRRLLGEGIDRYRWFAVTHDASGGSCMAAAPCVDRVPDAGLYTHVL